ncbi:hypothetical protein [Ralstonia pseudosolanacearum]|uniref:hypothetical protein n=1 Tax=Ralstonia pseudosolanacearum TaxID=1310165 RepID=UPI00048D0171|nr:hypothetical protein [Ralstonia pseudosolanacearum]MDO3556487.1 superoxide dismutase [Ralstonia pseudosolanacearum]MDO3576160.1 superoxide dismutase [Ralstonia pseudosolanacearum]MDO3585538.1 superoxide dismutase [Ralstonia pseudosolanacearum]
MKFLCLDIPQPGASLEKYPPHMHEETRHAWKLYTGGVVRDFYFRQDRPGVALIAEAGSIEAARAALNEFPLAKAGLIGWDVIPLGPFTGWQLLFAPGNT